MGKNCFGTPSSPAINVCYVNSIADISANKDTLENLFFKEFFLNIFSFTIRRWCHKETSPCSLGAIFSRDAYGGDRLATSGSQVTTPVTSSQGKVSERFRWDVGQWNDEQWISTTTKAMRNWENGGGVGGRRTQKLSLTPKKERKLTAVWPDTNFIQKSKY